MDYKDIVKLFEKSNYKTAITKRMPKDVLETVFNRALKAGINPFLPIFQIAVETSGLPKLHITKNNSHNWFNITALGNEKNVSYPVDEYLSNGKKIIKNVKFRVFDSLDDAVDNFIQLIKRSYPNYNLVNYRSLIHKNGRPYASADNNKNGNTYSSMVINSALDNFKKLGISDYSIHHLKEIFDSKTPSFRKTLKTLDKYKFDLKNAMNNLGINTIQSLDVRRNRRNRSKNMDNIKKENKGKDNIRITNNQTNQKRKPHVSRRIRLHDINTSMDLNRKNYNLEFVPKGVYVTYKGKTILLVNKTSILQKDFINLVTRGVRNEINWKNN